MGTQMYIKDYPRPQFIRTDWVNLNGEWSFGFDDENMGERLGWPKKFGVIAKLLFLSLMKPELAVLAKKSIILMYGTIECWIFRPRKRAGESYCTSKRLIISPRFG